MGFKEKVLNWIKGNQKAIIFCVCGVIMGTVLSMCSIANASNFVLMPDGTLGKGFGCGERVGNWTMVAVAINPEETWKIEFFDIDGDNTADVCFLLQKVVDHTDVNEDGEPDEVWALYGETQDVGEAMVGSVDAGWNVRECING